MAPDIGRRKCEPKTPNKLTGRLAEIFKYILKPCFNNLKSVDGYVWTGSTSEGFAITDHSARTTRGFIDEMDLMIPVAMPGYVYIHVRRDKTDAFTKEFLTKLCTTISSDTGEEDHFLSRSKLLKIQGDYVRTRLPAVQSKIDKTSREYGRIGGRVQLLQQGPVQTISVFYEATSEDGKTTAEFEQTVDCALALVCKEWPSIAKKWETRDRKWPASDVINAIIVAGCHVVPKSYPGEGGDECLQWRLSFSLAERTLAHTFTEKQRMFYLVVKKIWRMYLKEPKVLSSYHMKTTMFWVSEQTPAEKWTQFYLETDFLNFLIS
ncbi:nucleotidyltransferase MB21D2-like [Ptychodera flava]|uniref:nucleotidyltransferase MB21D2-like n=1 Tax=Ptychodera flava TaxID=63121 RepID=UPI00396A82AB